MRTLVRTAGLLILIVIVVFVASKNDWVQQNYSAVVNKLSGEKSAAEVVTFYQWTSASGELVVSREKPSHTENYISFQASADLMNSQHNVNQELIAKGNQAKSEYLNQTPQSKKRTGSITAADGGTIFSAPAKVKHCLGLSNQIAAKKREGKSSSELEKRHAREC